MPGSEFGPTPQQLGEITEADDIRIMGLKKDKGQVPIEKAPRTELEAKIFYLKEQFDAKLASLVAATENDALLYSQQTKIGPSAKTNRGIDASIGGDKVTEYGLSGRVLEKAKKFTEELAEIVRQMEAVERAAQEEGKRFTGIEKF